MEKDGGLRRFVCVAAMKRSALNKIVSPLGVMLIKGEGATTIALLSQE